MSTAKTISPEFKEVADGFYALLKNPMTSSAEVFYFLDLIGALPCEVNDFLHTVGYQKPRKALSVGKSIERNGLRLVK